MPRSNYSIFLLLSAFVLVSRLGYCDVINDKSEEEGITSNYQVIVEATKPIYITDERFLSVTLDGNLLLHRPKWDNFSFSSVKLHTLTRALSPAYIRFGGKESDFLIFKNSCDGEVQPNSNSSSTPVRTAIMCPSDWDGLNQFCISNGVKLIFGLNLLLRTKDGQWDPSNAVRLLDYNKYDVAWELGNEPNSFMKKANISLSGMQIAKDFNTLRKILQSKPKYVNVPLYGPDISSVGSDTTTTLLNGFLDNTNVTNGTTFHSYYLNGRIATVDDFLNPKTLDDLLPSQIDLVKSLVVKHRGNGAPIWLGESGSAYGGGAVNLSDRFVAGFLYLDKLGMSAKMGLKVVLRQAYYGGRYTMLDLETLDPKPDYWIAYIYKYLVGPQVLRTKIVHVDWLSNQSSKPDNNYFRVYAHCTTRRSGYRRGAVTLIMLNMHKTDSANITFLHALRERVIFQYLLTAHGPEGMESSLVNLNHRLLKLVNDTTLPKIEPVKVSRRKPLIMPPKSYGFYVVENAKAKACTLL